MPTYRPLYVWNGTEWVSVGPEVTDTPVVVQATAPTSPVTGTVWLDTSSVVGAMDPASLSPIGSVTAYAAATAPVGWLLCDGATYNISQYPTLGGLLLATYGGNGTTTFAVPDLRGRVPAGLDNMGGSDAGRLDWANSLGTSGGAQTHTLTESQMPAHIHSSYENDTAGGTSGWSGVQGAIRPANKAYTNYYNTGSTGGGTAHNNMQPTILLNYIIRAA